MKLPTFVEPKYSLPVHFSPLLYILHHMNSVHTSDRYLYDPLQYYSLNCDKFFRVVSFLQDLEWRKLYACLIFSWKLLAPPIFLLNLITAVIFVEQRYLWRFSLYTFLQLQLLLPSQVQIIFYAPRSRKPLSCSLTSTWETRFHTHKNNR